MDKHHYRFRIQYLENGKILETEIYKIDPSQTSRDSSIGVIKPWKNQDGYYEGVCVDLDSELNDPNWGYNPHPDDAERFWKVAEKFLAFNDKKEAARQLTAFDPMI